MADRNKVLLEISANDMATAKLKSVEMGVSSLASRVGSLSGLMAGAGLAAPFAAITKSTYAWALAVNDLTDATGMADEDASTLLAIGESVGLAGEKMQTAFIKMSKSVSAAQDSMVKAGAAGQASDDIYSRFGITVMDANNKLLPSEQILKNILEAHRNLPNGIEKTNMELEIFGRKGAEMNDLLNLQGSEIDRLTEKWKKAGLVIGNSQAFEDSRNKMRELELSVKGLSVQVGQGLLPVLQEKVDWLNNTADAVGKLDEKQKALIETTAILGVEMGAFKIILAGMLPGWLKLVGYIGLAVDAMNDYIDKANQIDGFAYTMTGETNLLGNGKYGSVQVGKAGDWEGGGMATGQKPRVDKRGGGDRNPPPLGGGAASNLDSMREKLANMINDFNAKIVQETGTAFEGNLAKLSAEVAKAQQDLAEMAAKGIDIAAGQAKVDEYSKTMIAKYSKDQLTALTDLKNDTMRINAEVTGNYKAEAAAQYQIELQRIAKDREAKTAAAIANKSDMTAIKAWENEAVKQAQQKQQKMLIDGAAQEHEQRLNTLQYQRDVLGMTSAVYTDAYQSELQAFVKTNTLKLQDAQIKGAERMQLEQKLSSAVAEMHKLEGQNYSTSWGEAWRRLETDSYDYSGRIVQAWQEMGSGISSSILNAIKGTGNGLMGIFSSITDSILKMWIDMYTQMYIMNPLKNMMMGAMGGKSGGGNWLSTLGGVFSGGGGSPQGFYSPGFANGGLAKGWSVVGERGIELVNFTNPGRVYTADQTREALSGSPRDSGRGNMIINVNQNISTPNSSSFRQSEGQLASGAARSINRNMRRNG